MALQESGEMYLETILRLSAENKVVRSVDVAEEMGFSKASVSRAMHVLSDGGYLQVERAGDLVLTKEGEKVARKIYERHKILTDYLMSIRIEHVISDKSFKVIKNIVKQG